MILNYWFFLMKDMIYTADVPKVLMKIQSGHPMMNFGVEKLCRIMK